MKKLIMLVLMFLCLTNVASAEDTPDYIDLSNQSIPTESITVANNGVLLEDSNIASNFDVVKNDTSGVDTVTVEALNESLLASEEQTIGIPVKDMDTFDEYVTVSHFNEAGVCDYTQVQKPYVADNYAYCNVSFTSVTISPLASQVQNWNFEYFTINTTIPNNFVKDPTYYVGAARSSYSKVGSYSYSINGSGSVRGYISQQMSITPGYYTIGAWVMTKKRNGWQAKH